MLSTNRNRWILLLLLLSSLFTPTVAVQAAQKYARVAQSGGVTAYDLIVAMNTLRLSNGLPALVEDPIINAVAQSTAEIMAANQMSWHIGDVDGRLAAAGYGGGSKVWATENFAVGNHTIDEIMLIWSDASHMIPAVNAAYCNVGAGVAKASNGRTYYVLQAAYTSGKACGEYTSPGGTTTKPGGSTGISQVIVPVKVATPDEDGKVFHVVEAGQSFWAIAIAYKITIKDLEIWNNISRDSKLQIGQRLFIPSSNTQGYATPTPVGMVQVSTPDAEGKIVHVVQPYQTLSTIAQAYQVAIDNILNYSGLQIDWPLQIEQQLVIHPGREALLSPIQKLTPASDGRYYHTVKSGETLSWIAGLYGVTLANLMAWNGLNDASIIRPDQKLLLMVTPPVTETATPAPATTIPSATPAPATPSSTSLPTPATPSPTATPEPASAAGGNSTVVWVISIGLVVGVLLFTVLSTRNKK